MLFNTPVFLLLFLPVALLSYCAVDKAYRNIILVIFNLIFFAFGEPIYILLLLLSIVVNFFLGLQIDKKDALQRKLMVAAAVAFNIGILAIFKYAEFLTASLGGFFSLFWVGLGDFVPIAKVMLPIGISFFALQGVSYVVDIYKKIAPPEQNFIKFALYISFFPKLIAGPLTRYNEIGNSLSDRKSSLSETAEGLKRFSIGLAKKVLIADNMAIVADKVFALGEKQLTISLSWVGLICFAFQIYYDFSGYIDMALGLGRVFGFKLPESFDYPYLATSIKNFWRRWNITVTRWFKDYLYIPLGGSRKGKKRVYFNLILVFVLYGLWHGTTWTFFFWGAFFGIFLLLERFPPFAKILNWVHPIVRWIYTMFVVLMGWVIFRADSFDHMVTYIKALFGFGYYSSVTGVFEYFDNEGFIALLFAFLLVSPFAKKGWDILMEKLSKRIQNLKIITEIVQICLLAFVVFLSIISIVNGTSAPSYFYRF